VGTNAEIAVLNFAPELHISLPKSHVIGNGRASLLINADMLNNGAALQAFQDGTVRTMFHII
jgi:hypothetical protein